MAAAIDSRKLPTKTESSMSNDGKWRTFKKFAGLMQYVPSGIYFARVKVKNMPSDFPARLMGNSPHYERASLSCSLTTVNKTVLTDILRSSKLSKTLVDLNDQLKRLDKKHSALHAAIAQSCATKRKPEPAPGH
jgi:hypothetical protein